MQVQNNVQAGGLSAVGAAIGGITTQASAETAEAAGTSTESTGAITTRDLTVALGNDGGGGYRKVVAAPGENWTLRTELLPSHSLPGSPTRRPLIAFAQMTDLHIIDDQSPMRTEYLDKYADPGPPYNAAWPTDASYRAHESLSTQLNDAMVRAIAKVSAAPATGLTLCMTLVTGDAIDNCQYNEARWYIDLLDGSKTINPSSGNGGHSVTDGLAGSKPDYWRPGTGHIFGTKHVKAGFPAIPGYGAASRRPFTSHGLGMPWYAALGNHDTLVQGNAPISTDVLGFDLSTIAVGDKKIITWNHEWPVGGGFTDWLKQAFYNNPVRISVVADARRRLLSKSQLIQEHFNTSGTPVGHGFITTSKGYYTIPSGADELFKFICLDTNAPIYKDGIIDDVQFQWLENELKACHSKYELTDGSTLTLPTLVHQAQVKDKLVVIFCHHTISSINNPLLEVSGKSGEDLKNLLWRFPNVIMVVNGHSHDNRIRPYKRNSTLPYSSNFSGGFWEINTASHIDWPIQSRIIEVTESSAGVLSIYTTMVDIDAPMDYAGDLSTPAALASLARELAANDPQEPIRAHGEDRRRGEPKDRNACLVLPMPFELQTTAPRLASARNADGRLDLCGANAAPAGQIFLRWQFSPGGTWSYWTQQDGYWLKAIATEANADGRLQLVGVNYQDQIFYKSQKYPGGAWTPWSWMDGGLASVAMARNYDGRLDLYGVNSQGMIWQRRQSVAGGAWQSNWTSIDGNMRQLAADCNTDGKMTLLGLDKNGALFHRTQTSPGGSWGPWIPNYTLYLFSIAVCRSADGRLQLFGSDHLGRVHTTIQTSPGASTWEPAQLLTDAAVTHGFMQSVTAEMNADGRIDLFGINSADDVWLLYQTTASGNWSNWVKLDPRMAPVPTTVPDLRERSLSQAQSILESRYLYVGSVTHETTSYGELVGKVLRSAPSKGVSVLPGTSINLTLGKSSGGGRY